MHPNSSLKMSDMIFTFLEKKLSYMSRDISKYPKNVMFWPMEIEFTVKIWKNMILKHDIWYSKMSYYVIFYDILPKNMTFYTKNMTFFRHLKSSNLHINSSPKIIKVTKICTPIPLKMSDMIITFLEKWLSYKSRDISKCPKNVMFWSMEIEFTVKIWKNMILKHDIWS